MWIRTSLKIHQSGWVRSRMMSLLWLLVSRDDLSVYPLLSHGRLLPCVWVSLLFLNRQQLYWTLISPSTWEFESHVRHADHNVRATDDLWRLITMTRHDPFPLCNHPAISAINKQVIYTIGANYYPRTCVTDILEEGWGSSGESRLAL